jgi:hypothetical protein
MRVQALGVAKAVAKGDIETVKKVDAGVNKKKAAPSNAAKLDAETETFHRTSPHAPVTRCACSAAHACSFFVLQTST